MAEEAEFGGKCAFAVALGGPEKAPAGKAKYSLEQDGKTYYFSGAVPKMLFSFESRWLTVVGPTLLRRLAL